MDTLEKLITGDDGNVALQFSEPVQVDVPEGDSKSSEPGNNVSSIGDNNDPQGNGSQSDELDTEFAILAKSFKDRGIIDDEIKIEKGFDFNSLEKAFEESFRKKQSDLIRQEVYEELRNEGITEDVISSVKLNKAGVSGDELNELNVLYTLATVDINQYRGDEAEKELFAWTKLRYEYAGYKPEDAENAASRDIDRDEATAIKENKEFFSSLYNKQSESVKEKEEQAKLKEKEKIEEEKGKVVNLIDSGKVGGVEFSKKDIESIKKAFFEQTEVVKVGGKHYKMTLLQRRLMEEKSNLEAQVLKNINLVLGITPQKAKELGKEEGENELARKFLEKSKQSGYVAKPSENGGGSGFILSF